MLPNFFIAGVPTSGTTSLYHFLRQHPQVYVSRIKEPTYFAAPDMQSRDAFLRVIRRDTAAMKAWLDGPQNEPARFWLTDWDDYLKLFRDADGERAVGEASVSYFWLPSAAPAIRAAVPRARLVFLLRHPAERLFSWYLMRRERYPRLAFRAWYLEAKDAGGDGGPQDDRHTLPLDGGRTAAHFQRFFDHFPREQIGVWLHESFAADPHAVLREIFAFLQVDSGHPVETTARHNETVVLRFPALDRLRRRLFGNAALARWLPPAAPRVAYDAYRRTRRHFSMDAADRQLVIGHYRDDILRTQDLIQRDLSAWLR
jgi:hypothetical protein